MVESCICIILHFGLYLDGKANTIACVYFSLCNWEILRLNPDNTAAIQKIYSGWKELLSSFAPVDQRVISQWRVLVSSRIQNWAFGVFGKELLTSLWLWVSRSLQKCRVWLHVSWMHHVSILITLPYHFSLNVCVRQCTGVLFRMYSHLIPSVPQILWIHWDPDREKGSNKIKIHHLLCYLKNDGQYPATQML